MNGATVLTRFTADTKDFDTKTKNVNTSISSIAKGVIAATGVTKAFGAAWNLVRNSMDGAISRFDIMNNFPKVMGNLGIAASEAQESLDTMSEKLMGLPTTLDEGALAVQRFTSANNDVKKSTEIFLAVNNAILAGGAGAAIQSSALEQLSQAYAKGKPDVIEWRTLMTAMPAQLKQVSEAMGYINAEELGGALRDGSESMDAFMDTIVRLNQEGLPGLGNFEEQARNATDGIQTALKNMKSRTIQGVTAMIDAIDQGLQDANIGKISTILEEIGNFFRDNLKNLAPYVTQFVVVLANIGKWIVDNKDFLEAIIVPLTAFIVTFATISKVISIVKGITTAIGVLNAVLLANPITLIIAAIAALIAVFVLAWNKCEWFRNLWIGLWEGIKSIVSGVIDWFKSIPGKVSQLVNSVIDIAKGIVVWFKELPGKMLEIGKNIIHGIWDGIKNAKDWLWNKITGFANGIVQGFKDALGIKSPSKEFAIIGKYSVLGYNEGLEKMDSEVQKQLAETFAISPQISPMNSMHLSPNIQVSNNISMQQDPLGQMVNDIKTFAGGAKNDYNYGAGF